ncbi:ATP-dependent helicase/nuclease subunit A [Clostridium tepidiprofundi DSM 19306]|uniref:ATP-dependent helicase/nuclease subunit A n=2 Tax=Clostridium TaxID=1485 RepID=A0A151B2U6_9CLOT|nr:helicase-exonuclease AddAB subunit AddA [Clostridium tepidiprofundi]KYH34216.1 ATP-dependent helicase/nuclease subunit A [Clostridium tepidiprofundi DSM 19306]
MADVKWTKEQKAAIDTHDCNLLVAAAAGSGKTAVLVERIINMITNKENPIDIDKLLVVTFTNAAASEMRERIAEAISKEIHKTIEPSPFLQRQLTLLNKASITTIHSFCLEVIRNNFHMIDLDPGFRIADDTEIILIKQEVIDEIFDEKYLQIENASSKDNVNEEYIEEEYIEEEYNEEKTNEEEHNEEKYNEDKAESVACPVNEFLRLIECYCNNKDDIMLKNMVLNLYNFSVSMPNPEKWLKEKVEELNFEKDDFESLKWVDIIKRDINIELQGLENIMERAVRIINNTPELEPYSKNFNDEYLAINDAVKACNKSWKDMIEAINEIKFGRLKSIRKCNDTAIKEKVQNMRKNVSEKIKEIKKLLENLISEDSIEDIHYMYYIVKSLVKLVMEFKTRFALKKRERGIVDFNDFEHFCLDILIKKDENGRNMVDDMGRYVPSEVAEKLRNKYEEILIDEYQDSNMIQEEILNIISKERIGFPNIFMVGDVKQSIYRFRQAKPELFLSKYNTYSEKIGEKYRKIMLFKNFRSRKQVVDAVNFIFEQIMSENVGELEYDEKEALNYGADYSEEDIKGITGGDVEIHLIQNENIEEFEKENNDDEPMTNIQLEAEIVSKRIKEFIEGKEESKKSNENSVFNVFDKKSKKYRPVEYRDIVILLRSTSKWAPVFVEALKNNDIPVYADVGTGYFDTVEIKTIMSLLQIIDNPRQDIPLLAVMRSPIGGFTPEELIDIRVVDKEIPFYEAILKTIENTHLKIDDNIRKKLLDFTNKLEEWREKSHNMPIDEFIWYLYKDTGYYGFVGAMNAGIQRQANLRILFQRARQYEQTSYRGLFNFINFINKLRKSSGDMGSAKILGENENVVRIMSIHKSKGLEFPIVFVSGMGKKFNLQDLTKKLLLHHELGFGPEYIDVKRRITYSTVVKEALKKKILKESLSEEMRILYVAFTRAREKLIMTGSIKNIEDYCKKYSSAIDNDGIKLLEYDVSKARTYFDWIIPAVMRHKNGFKLREAAGISTSNEDDSLLNLIEDESKWEIKFWDRSSTGLKTEGEEIIDEKDLIEYIEHYLHEYEKEITKYDKFIENRLGFEYRFRKSCELPTVITVTELKKRMNSESDVENGGHLYMFPLNKKPQFLEETKGLTAVEKGTAMHAALQYLNIEEELDYNNIKKQINSMVIRELLTPEQGESVNINKIVKFFKSKLGTRMIEANKRGKLYREVPFHISISSTELEKELPKEIYEHEKILLQGIIDCYFEEEGKLILVDYKTDYVDDLDKIVDKYNVQLQYYARALNEISGMKVSEIYLYLFWKDKQVKVK